VVILVALSQAVDSVIDLVIGTMLMVEYVLLDSSLHRDFLAKVHICYGGELVFSLFALGGFYFFYGVVV
jgi:hypothetical protein